MSEFKFFENKKPNFKNLTEFGFVGEKDGFIFEKKIADNQFLLKIFISNEGCVDTKVEDIITKEPYTLHLVEGASGKFVGQIKTEFEQVLSLIADECFDRNIFKTPLSKEISNYLKEKYNSNLEYLWEKYPNCAIARRDDNKKWYFIIMAIPKNKIGLKGTEIVEIIDLRMEKTEKEDLLNKKGYFPAYHMNKNTWFTVLLDDSVSKKEIFSRIDKSFKLAHK